MIMITENYKDGVPVPQSPGAHELSPELIALSDAFAQERLFHALKEAMYKRQLEVARFALREHYDMEAIRRLDAIYDEYMDALDNEKGGETKNHDNA